MRQMPHFARLPIVLHTVERMTLRRFLGVLLFCSAIVLIAAEAPPAATPAPAPLQTPTPGPTAPPVQQQPSVLVYPFDVQTGVDSKIGTAIATILAQEMVQAGGISVLPVPQGVARKDFLQTARSQHADFYISGYVTPVGDSASVVEQVVSVDSGVILFSQTAQVSSVEEVASQSLLARAQILAFVGRATENVDAQSSATPAPSSTNGAKMNIQGVGGIVDSVFHHKGRGVGASPSPTPAVKPQRGVIVTPMVATGTVPVPPSVLASANAELIAAFGRVYQTQSSNVSSNLAQAADSICGSNRDNTIAGSSLSVVYPKHGKMNVSVALSIYTCFGAVLDTTTGTGDSVKSAVDAAVKAYATAHPDNS